MTDASDAPETPQIYLITPPVITPEAFAETLSHVLDQTDVAALRLTLATTAEDDVARAADALREICHTREIALLVTDHVQLVERLGLDGVHLSDGARRVRKTRADLGADVIVGAACSASRHDGLAAGEAGADYVAFAPVGTTTLGASEQVPPDLFDWWSEMIEIPVVAEGHLTRETVALLQHSTDFFAVGAEIWDMPDPAAALSDLTRALAS